MFKSMASNSDKTHDVNINASSKDSFSLSFFRLDKNCGPREYDTSNKVLPNSQPKQSNDNSIEPVRNSVTSVQDGKSVEFCCLYCKNVYKSGSGLKGHTNKCKEREKDLDKHESSVINHPPIENDTVDMTRQYTWSQNGKIISSSTIDSIYNKIVFWRKNLFLSPSGACDKRYIKEITGLLNEWVSDSPLKDISFKAIDNNKCLIYCFKNPQRPLNQKNTNCLWSDA